MKKAFFYFFCLVIVLAAAPAYAARLVDNVPDSCMAAKPAVTSIKDALKELSSLTHTEKRARFKEVKTLLKQYKADKKAGKDVDSNLLLQVILSIILPPLAVYLHEGDTNNKFWISVLLTVLGLLIFGFAGVLFLGTLPSIIYALIVVLSN